MSERQAGSAERVRAVVPPVRCHATVVIAISKKQKVERFCLFALSLVTIESFAVEAGHGLALGKYSMLQLLE